MTTISRAAPDQIQFHPSLTGHLSFFSCLEELRLALSLDTNPSQKAGEASCLPIFDRDYEIYEGRLDQMYGHESVFCSTDGETTKILEPDPAHDTYYLVVPTNGSQEGSYGRGSDGVQRPASSTPCRPQQIVPCFSSGGP